MNDQNLNFLPYGKQYIDDDDIDAVTAVLRSGWLTTGPAVSQFETDFKAHVGVAHAIACANGTAALHLSMIALGIGPGDAVIVPTLTFLATANAVRYVNAEVVFCDVEPDTGLMNAKTLQHALDTNQDKNIKAVIPVHLNGQCVDMVAISTIASKHDLYVVEDACHAIGGSHQDTHGQDFPIGSCVMSDMSIFSLHPVKTITMGEGGVVTTNDKILNDRLRLLRAHGMTREPTQFTNTAIAFDENGVPNPWYYEMHDIGYNYRATDIQCALGVSQLKKLDLFTTRREELVACYDEMIKPLAPLLLPIGRTSHGRTGWHLYVVLIDFAKAAVSRANVVKRLNDSGIGTQVHYLPVHQQPYYKERYGKLNLIGASKYYARCLSLPLYPEMRDRDVQRVCHALKEVLGLL